MIELNRVARVAPVAVMLVLAAVGLDIVPRAAAASEDVFTIEKVAVDATAETAAAARELALAAGHRIAYRRLIARLVPVERQREVQNVDANRLVALVRDFEVEEEKTSSVRYLATLQFRFNRLAIRDLLKAEQIPFAETPSKPQLVFPVYRVAGTNLLWDDPNPWRDSWVGLPASDGLLPLIIPSGNLADINDISAAQAVRGQQDRLKAIAGRYGAAGVIVVQAARGYHRTENAPVLQVVVTYFGGNDDDRTQVQSFVATPGQSEPQLLAAAAAAVMRQIEEDWKAQNLLRFDQQAELVAIVPLQGLEDWVKLQRKLSDVALLWASELVALTRSEAMVRLRYFGDEHQLRGALNQNDVSLTRAETHWILRLAGADQARSRGVEGETR